MERCCWFLEAKVSGPEFKGSLRPNVLKRVVLSKARTLPIIYSNLETVNDRM